MPSSLFDKVQSVSFAHSIHVDEQVNCFVHFAILESAFLCPPHFLVGVFPGCLHFCDKVKGNVTKIILGIAHNLTPGCCGEGVTTFCKNLQQIVEIADPEWAPYWTNYKMLKVCAFEKLRQD